MRVRTIVASVLLSSALALAGCTDPQPVVPKEPTASASAEPTAALPTLPAAATKDTEAGAIAFVKYYIELLNFAANTGDTDRLREASEQDCEGCESYIEYINSVYESGDEIAGVHWVPVSSTAGPIEDGYAVSAQFNAEKSGKEDTVYDLYFEISGGPTPRVSVFERSEK